MVRCSPFSKRPSTGSPTSSSSLARASRPSPARVFEDELAHVAVRRPLQELAARIGREGLRLGHFQESLISLSRLLLFLTAKMEGPRYSKEDVARLKPMKSDVTALADHCRGQEERITSCSMRRSD